MKKEAIIGGEILLIGATVLGTHYFWPREKIAEVMPVQTPDFGVKYNADLNTCDVIDNKTGEVVSVADHPYLTFGRKETGVGKTESIPTTLEPGQTAIIEGYTVNGKIGVFEVVSAGDQEITFPNEISDGAITVVDENDAPFAFANAVQTAIEKGWAHNNVRVPEEWRVK